MNKKILFAFGFWCATAALFAQHPLDGFGIEPNLYVGSMVKHTPTMIGSPVGPSRGFTLNLSYETHGKHVWESLYRYPTIGFYGGFMNIDNGDIFGEAYYAAPYIAFSLKQKPTYKTYLQVGLGGAYLTKKYNEATNTTNNAIGSHWNGAFNLRYGAQFSLAEHWALTTGVGINHFSNAGTTPKNLGINLCDAQIGLKYMPHPVKRADYQSLAAVIPEKRWDVEASYYSGIEQHNVALGGAFYPVHNGVIGVGYRKSYKHRWVAGFEYEHNKKSRVLMEHIERFDPEDYFKQSSLWMFFVGEEMKIGNLSLLFNMGVHFQRTYQIEKQIYNKYGIRYYVVNTPDFKLHLDAYLKTELIDAQFVAVGMGMQFL